MVGQDRFSFPISLASPVDISFSGYLCMRPCFRLEEDLNERGSLAYYIKYDNTNHPFDEQGKQ